jgi:hypothetical protein
MWWKYTTLGLHPVARGTANMVTVFSETSNLFHIHGSVHRNNILIYIQQDATLHSLFYLETALHVSGATITSRKIQIFSTYRAA